MLEKVVAFQNVRKLATSRLMTPPMAAGSKRLIAQAPGGARCAAMPSSLRLLPCEQHEHVLERRRAPDRVRWDGPVGGLLRAHDRDRRPGRAHPEPLRLGLRAHLGEP